MRYCQFIQKILDDIGPGTFLRRYYFTIDNLNSHRSLVVLQLIHQAGHRVVFRAPYHPVDGPIEYYLNHVQNDLRLSMYGMQQIVDVKAEVRATLRNTSTSRPYFLNVGFPDN